MKFNSAKIANLPTWRTVKCEYIYPSVEKKYKNEADPKGQLLFFGEGKVP